jgi:Flp pilus assembly protein TadD
MPRLAELSELRARLLEEFHGENFEAALEISQQMLALAPHFWQVYLYRAFANDGLDNFLGVVENYQQVLMRQPDNHLALNNLAYHYLLREVQIDKAVEMAERAVELERRDIYLDTLGYGYYLVGRYEEAKELLLEALETAPEGAVEEITAHLDLVLKALGEAADE